MSKKKFYLLRKTVKTQDGDQSYPLFLTAKCCKKLEINYSGPHLLGKVSE